MDIRLFQESDAPAVIALWKSVFGYSAAHNDPALAIRKKLALQRDLFFVAEEDSKIAGTVMGGYDGHRGWIYSLAVLPEARKNKIGTALMQRVEAALKELGAVKINLQLVASNVATVEFYKKLGYAIEERISMGKIM
ncbi:MAG TPA: GNAT family acetyltransferase [Planctomycetota bacterium]|nr:GNAT family acetyltransferase [Planctomycetota bacterium]